MTFTQKTLTNWKDIHSYSRHGWIYRGQREAGWGLQPSFERCCMRQGVIGKQKPIFETRLFREFRRTYPLYAQHIPEESSIIEWLSLMQHHGAPTRLLDFTYSIYVAAYFATEEADGDSAIWAADANFILQEACDIIWRAGKDKAPLKRMRDGTQFRDAKDEQDVADLFLKRPYSKVCWPVNAFRLNQRLTIQRGVFLVPGDIRVPFEENLASLKKAHKQEKILKIVIPSAVGRVAIRELFSMGISRTSLYPGLDGFARSLAIWHSAYEPIRWGNAACH